MRAIADLAVTAGIVPKADAEGVRSLIGGLKDARGLPLSRRRSILEDAIEGFDVMLPVRRREASGERAWPYAILGQSECPPRKRIRRWRIGDVDGFDGVLVGRADR